MIALYWVVILMCLSFFGGMAVAYVAFSPKFDRAEGHYDDISK